MPSYKGTRVAGVSLLGVVPGTVDIQPPVGEVYARIDTKHIHMHTFQASSFVLALDRQKAAIQRLLSRTRPSRQAVCRV